MLKRLIDFVSSDTSRPPFQFTLQDISLCQLWYESQVRQQIDTPITPLVRQRIEAWKQSSETPDVSSAGRRHQRLLRVTLARLENTPKGLVADEVAFLHAALTLAETAQNASQQTRFLSRIRPHQDTLLKLLALGAPSSDLHHLEMHIVYASAADILGAETTSVRILAGIEVPSRGPVFKARNHLRILGDVPENCTVVVENEGSCSVDGYVLGRILTKSDCEIRHNISGVAIVLHGDVRARSIINNAFVVSKMGSVFCRNAQGPKLVFAGRSIEVAESTMLGKYITRDMNIGDEARGSHIEIAGEAQARQFRNLGMSNINIVLRRELSCDDFGEISSDGLKKLLSQAYALRRNAHNFKNMSEAAQREADHTAQSVLMYIFGGGEVQKRLQGFLHAQRRHTLATNVVTNLENILERAQDRLYSRCLSDEAESNFNSHEDMEQDSELMAAREEAEKFNTSLSSSTLNTMQQSLLLEQVRQKLSDMRGMQREAEEQLREQERSLQHLEKYEQVLAGAGANATKIDVLNRILPAMNKQAPESAMGKRLRSGFVVRALRTVDRAGRHATEFGQKADQYLSDFRAVSERLGKDYQVRVLENPESEEVSARVSGIFDDGIRIYMDVYTENIGDIPKDAVIITERDDGVRTYIRPKAGGRFHGADRR